MLLRLHPLVVADVAFAFGQADERTQHDVLAVVHRIPARFGDGEVAHVLLGHVGSEEVVMGGQHGQPRRVQSFRFAAPCGASPLTKASTWRTVSKAWLSLAGGVRPPIWGVAITFGRRASSGGGI